MVQIQSFSVLPIERIMNYKFENGISNLGNFRGPYLWIVICRHVISSLSFVAALPYLQTCSVPFLTCQKAVTRIWIHSKKKTKTLSSAIPFLLSLSLLFLLTSALPFHSHRWKDIQSNRKGLDSSSSYPLFLLYFMFCHRAFQSTHHIL